ncbi:hypothetical protein DCD74_09020 [Lysobacter oculi]|uniref:Lipoprotein n=1 Tax=Solilutibacter oculi TaxID=2698682 RepID=A0A344J6Z6_9GAMM|nr:hypothetical protein [Lysobacter oculi]AXA84806.1 hypothetical protein DCD74_09020 [Lysobacter oculi]
MKRLLLPLALLAALSACKKEEDPQAAAAAQAAQQEAAAAPLKRNFDEALAAKNWELALSQADELRSRYPGTQAAAAIAPQYAEVDNQAKSARAERRLKNLWDYQSVPAGKGRQLSAAIMSKERIDMAEGRSTVQLIFRDHPEWGRSAYLVMQRGDFNCYGGCRLKLKVDGKPRTLAGSRPKTDEAIAMFIEDEAALWRIFKSAQEVSIEFPVKPSGTRIATFESGGLDPGKLPKWK